MQYRADIDGLRAIAIILVLIYHGGLSLFPSGFIGVDIFFVISGFLITTIIHNALADNFFSFIAFYNRRLWRLQPILIAYILVATALTLVFFLPEDLIQYSRSARKTAFFISNLFFKQSTTGYFSPDTHQLPLLHTWSLSIEWQCYLFLPIFLVALHKVCKPHIAKIVIYCLTGCCLLLSWHYSESLPEQTYYQFTSRLFEFLIGACLAVIAWKPTQQNSYLLNGLGAAAIISIFYVASLDGIAIAYPNGYAVLVCLATGFLIAVGRFYPNERVVSVLSWPPLVFIGVLSYSLYLWHWLVFSMLRYQNIPESWAVLGTAYAGIFVLSYLSWKYVETPCKRLTKVKFRYTLVSLLLIPIAIIHTIDFALKKNSGFPQRFNEELVHVYQALDKYQSTKRPLCISNRSNNPSNCTLGSLHAEKKGLLIGDSFSNHYWGFIDALAKNSKIAVVAQGTSSCLTLPGIVLYDWWHFKNKVYTECQDETARYFRMIKTNHYDYVFLGQIWSNYLSDSVIHQVGDKRSLGLAKRRIARALDKALTRISASGARPVLIKSTATLPSNLGDCFFKHIKRRQAYQPERCQFLLSSSAYDLWFDKLFATMQSKYPQLLVIDPKKVQCSKNKCAVDVNGVPVFRDAGHITDYASYQFGMRYLKQFGNPLGSVDTLV